MKLNKQLEAISTIVGTIIGAGIFTLPLALEESGAIGFLMILLLSVFASFLLTAYVGELTFSAKKTYQLPNLISKYLGAKFKSFTLVLEEVTIFGALVAYFVGIALLLSIFVSKLFVYISLSVLAIIIAYGNFYTLERLETPVLIAKLALIVLFSALVSIQFNPSNIGILNSKIFGALGLLIFSMASFTVIPEVREELGGAKYLNRTLIISYLISAALYVFFAFSFAGAFGPKVDQIAIQNLGGTLGVYGIIFGIFMMLTPLMTLSLAATDVLVFDFSFPRKHASLIAGCIPLVLALFSHSFAYIIEIVGGVFLSILSLLVLITVLKKRQMKAKSIFIVPGGNITLLFALAFFSIALIFTFLTI